jgi:hypothetical protein
VQTPCLPFYLKKIAEIEVLGKRSKTED